MEFLHSGINLCAEMAEKTYFKRLPGIEKVHRNSIKITVDLWNTRPILRTGYAHHFYFDKNIFVISSALTQNTEIVLIGKGSISTGVRCLHKYSRIGKPFYST